MAEGKKKKTILFFNWTILFIVFVFGGCGSPSAPCGVFTFTGVPHTNRGIDMNLGFAFDPALCSASPCTCDSIVYIQIVRILDLQTGNFLYPSSEQAARTVTGNPVASLNGWAVDRLSGRTWGYYGRNNDGTFASTLTPGNNNTNAVLKDSPWGWADNTWFDAVSVPVCIDRNSGCVNNLIGYYYWLFIVESGTASDPFHEIAVTWHQDAFDAAVEKWNSNAPGAGKILFPAFHRMP